MKFEKCLEMLSEINKYNEVYLTIETTEDLFSCKDCLLDDLRFGELSTLFGLDVFMMFWGLHDGNDECPLFLIKYNKKL